MGKRKSPLTPRSIIRDAKTALCMKGPRMNIAETYDYVVRARRDLWAALRGVPDEVLSRPLLDGAKFHCTKDVMFHEMRHTAQITVLLRTQGIKPPALDLYYYLPIA